MAQGKHPAKGGRPTKKRPSPTHRVVRDESGQPVMGPDGKPRVEPGATLEESRQRLDWTREKAAQTIMRRMYERNDERMRRDFGADYDPRVHEVTTAQLGGWERNENEIPLRYVPVLADLYNLDVDADLLGIGRVVFSHKARQVAAMVDEMRTERAQDMTVTMTRSNLEMEREFLSEREGRAVLPQGER